MWTVSRYLAFPLHISSTSFARTTSKMTVTLHQVYLWLVLHFLSYCRFFIFLFSSFFQKRFNFFLTCLSFLLSFWHPPRFRFCMSLVRAIHLRHGPGNFQFMFHAWYSLSFQGITELRHYNNETHPLFYYICTDVIAYTSTSIQRFHYVKHPLWIILISFPHCCTTKLFPALLSQQLIYPGKPKIH